jgi:acetate kinase
MAAARLVLTVNGGSSSVKFAVFTLAQAPRRMFGGVVDRGGSVEADVIGSLESRGLLSDLAAMGHRLVHGGPDHRSPERITDALVADLRRLIPFAPNHLPGEIGLIEAFRRLRPALPQVACFDTAFHHQLPEQSRVLPIPRRFEARGVRRYGFHGLSYAYLMLELERIGGPSLTDGRMILAHLGSGASLAAIHGGRCVDTSMGLTPTGGVVMGTRSGDLDPGLVTYLLRTEGWSVDHLDDVLDRESGLLGLSETTADMRTLLANEGTDSRARLAVQVFCYQIKKWIGAFAAALGGVETLVFTGGIGQHAAVIRTRICDGLSFLGLSLDEVANTGHQAVISAAHSRVSVRVIPTDEELMIARAAFQMFG